MLALVFDGTPRLAEVPAPELSEGEALLRVLLAGICGTDHELLAGYRGFRGIPGHEFVGLVEKSPDPAWVGARVVAEINIACGQCSLCREGMRLHCERRQALGIAGRPGAFAERVALPLDNLHRVPESISDEEAVFVEPLAAALAVRDLGINSGEQVLVLGDGRMAALIAQGLRLRRARAEVAGKHPEKMALFQSLGIPPVEETPRPVYPWVVEATGSPQGLSGALAWVRPRGTVILKSTCHELSSVDSSRLVVDEIRVVGSRCGDFGPALEALAWGAVQVKPLISAVYPFGRAVEALGKSRKPGVFKVLLDFR